MNRWQSFGNVIVGLALVSILVIGIWLLTLGRQSNLLAATPTAIFTPTVAPSPTVVPSPSPTLTPSPLPPTQTPTALPTNTSTPRPTETATPSSTATATRIPPTFTPTSIPAEAYAAIAITSAASDRPAAQHADLNLGLRGYVPTQSFLGLVDYGDAVHGGPQLAGLFETYRVPIFTSVYRVYDWNWPCNCKGNVIEDWDVTLVGLATRPGELIYTPDTGKDIFAGYRAMVLYADTNRITIKYGRDDNVIKGYALHIEDVVVDPHLLALYQRQNSASRSALPALQAHQRVGRALGNEIKVAVRDDGAFMDPRSRKDWWSGR